MEEKKIKFTQTKKFKFLISLLMIVILAVILLNQVYTSQNQKQQDNEAVNKLTDYINSVGGVLYYRPACEFCQIQEQYINITLLKNKINVGYPYDNGSWRSPYKDGFVLVDGSFLQGTPTWVYGNMVHVGWMDTNQLKQFFGYNG